MRYRLALLLLVTCSIVISATAEPITELIILGEFSEARVWTQISGGFVWHQARETKSHYLT